MGLTAWLAELVTAHCPVRALLHVVVRECGTVLSGDIGACRPRISCGRIRGRAHHDLTIAAGHRRSDVLQPPEGDVLRFTKIGLVKLATPLAVGYPILAATRPVLLACGVSTARTLERERTRRRIGKPSSPRSGVDLDLRSAT